MYFRSHLSYFFLVSDSKGTAEWRGVQENHLNLPIFWICGQTARRKSTMPLADMYVHVCYIIKVASGLRANDEKNDYKGIAIFKNGLHPFFLFVICQTKQVLLYTVLRD